MATRWTHGSTFFSTAFWNSAGFMNRLIVAIWHRLSIRAAAPSPLPVILTVMLTLGLAFMKYSAKASAIGPTVVDPSI